LPGVYLLVLRAVWPKQFLIMPLKDSRLNSALTGGLPPMRPRR
jgi:hypothetical protein